MNVTLPRHFSLPRGKMPKPFISTSWEARPQWSERRKTLKKVALTGCGDKVCRRWQRGNIWRNRTPMADSDNTRKRHDVGVLSHDSNALSRRQDGREGGGLEEMSHGGKLNWLHIVNPWRECLLYKMLLLWASAVAGLTSLYVMLLEVRQKNEDFPLSSEPQTLNNINRQML